MVRQFGPPVVCIRTAIGSGHRESHRSTVVFYTVTLLDDRRGRIQLWQRNIFEAGRTGTQDQSTFIWRVVVLLQRAALCRECRIQPVCPVANPGLNNYMIKSSRRCLPVVE